MFQTWMVSCHCRVIEVSLQSEAAQGSPHQASESQHHIEVAVAQNEAAQGSPHKKSQHITMYHQKIHSCVTSVKEFMNKKTRIVETNTIKAN